MSTPLPRAKFAGIEFPASRYTIRGGLRHHVHEYPHTAGGALEKLGRRLYEIHFECDLHEANALPGYPSVWPTDWNQLRTFFEVETSEDLVIPTLGTITAVATEWVETRDARRQSGIKVDLTFREDTTNDVTKSSLVGQAINNANAMPDFIATISESGNLLDIFSAIQNLVNQILAYKDQAELYGSLLLAKVDGLINMVTNLIDSRPELQLPENWEVTEALKNLGYTAMKMQDDLLLTSTPMTTYTVPGEMSVIDVSSVLYGDSSRAIEIMKLNAIADPLHIKPTTVLEVYAA